MSPKHLEHLTLTLDEFAQSKSVQSSAPRQPRCPNYLTLPISHTLVRSINTLANTNLIKSSHGQVSFTAKHCICDSTVHAQTSLVWSTASFGQVCIHVCFANSFGLISSDGSLLRQRTFIFYHWLASSRFWWTLWIISCAYSCRTIYQWFWLPWINVVATNICTRSVLKRKIHDACQETQSNVLCLRWSPSNYWRSEACW